MDAFKNIFNPTNLLVVVVLIGLYLFRHSLFPESNESGDVKRLLGRVDSVIGRLDMVEAPPKQESAEVSPVQSVPVAMPASPKPQTEAPVTSQAVEDIPEAPTSQEQAASVEAGESKAAGDSADAFALWQTARRAAWEGNSDAAVENYRTLIAMQPENYDAYGEMGNVLLRMGDNDAAVEAYAQSAQLLGRSGYPQAAWQVMNIVSRLDQQRAQQLHESLYGQPLPKVQQ